MEALLAVVKSQIWVGNSRLIELIWKKLIELKAPEIPAEFWATTMDEGDELLVAPIVTAATLQTLVESGLWQSEPWLLEYILGEFGNLTRDERINFGTPEFWSAVFQDENEVVEWGGADRPIREFFTIGEESNLRVQRFNTDARGYSIHFRHVDEITPILLHLIFEEILKILLNGQNVDDRIGVKIVHPSLDARVLVPFCRQADMNADRILSIIERVQQSNRTFDFDEGMHLKIIVVENPAGSGGKQAAGSTSKLVNWKQWFNYHCGHGGCFIQIVNKDDDLCLARAVVTAQARVDGHPRWETMRKGDNNGCTLQLTEARNLMASVGLGEFKGKCGLEEVKKIQALLASKYQIKIFAREQFNCLIFEGEVTGEGPKKILHLYLHDGHFDVITKMPAFMGRSYFCELCNHGYSNRNQHRCNKDGCPGCHSEKHCKFEEWVKCKECNRWLPSKTCYELHKTAKTSFTTNGKVRKCNTTCEMLKRCTKCNACIESQHLKRHRCNQFFCSTCNKNVEKGDHECYMKVTKGEPNQKLRPVFIFFDFETRQDEANEEADNFKHIPNCCIAYRLCDTCRNAKLDVCTNCGENRHIFMGETCLDDFGAWLFSPENRGATAIAHNSKGFDSQFLLEYLHKQKTVIPKIVSKGMEILMLEAGGIRVIDTLNFLPMALAKFPKTFNVPELKKGYFPHFFNTKANWSYEGVLPDSEYYGIDAMSKHARKEFLEWYNAEKASGKIFNLQQEMLAYCESDVHILATCALKFRDIFLAETGVDPFLTSLTIASACNIVYRRNFLKSNMIGIIPHGGYNRNEKQSVIALKWLKWVSATENIRIRHKLNGGEVRIQNFRVDGLAGKTVYEFHGCFWHGCPKCMPKRTKMTVDNTETAEGAYQRTVERTKFLQGLGYAVVEKWECDLKNELRVNVEMKKFFTETKVNEPLGPRDAFYGGRTNAIKLYHKCSEGERIDYVDVCSLYPYICKMGIFPIKHPKILTENFENLDQRPYTGVIKCTILPPQKLYHPVLPYRCNGKLMFPLCRTCAADEMDDCAHTPVKHALNGSWVTMELYKAIEMGYEVLEIDEVWHYPETVCYNSETKTGGLFADYINKFLRLKQQADGWPRPDMSDAEKDAYITEYEQKEGVKLEKSQISKNPGMRALAKLMLNSFWGKFGQRNNMSQTQYFKDPQPFFDLIFGGEAEVSAIRLYGESLACVTYCLQDEFLEALTNTNPVIASFVTSQARLKLYSYIEKLDQRVLYFDTDSIVYLTRPDDSYKVPTGCFLGEMTNELKAYGEDAFISEFVAGGPKNYGYKVTNSKGEVVGGDFKVRGIRLSFNTSKTVNFDELRSMVFNYCMRSNRIVKTILEKRILRDYERNVWTKMCKKDYRIVYNKRVLCGDFTTVPYGFKNG